MTITAKITAEDVRSYLNGTVTGSTFYFWDQTLSSGSLNEQIIASNNYLYDILGTTVMDSTVEITLNHVKTCELLYSCMRVLVLLSGGVIVEGFNWSAGVSIQQPAMLPTFKNLIQELKIAAENHLRAIQPIAVHEFSVIPQFSKTSPSVM